MTFNTLSYFATIQNRFDVITAIPNSRTFPEFLPQRISHYTPMIELFREIVMSSQSSYDVLFKIRNPGAFSAEVRMSLLKIYRRCVCTVLDTEATKKITKIPTSDLYNAFGEFFKDIKILQEQFSGITNEEVSSLASLLGEYDDRGQQGYVLTDIFFDWFEEKLGSYFSIDGPRGAGRDIELSSIFPQFVGSCPCDFIIKDLYANQVRAIGFARYDSTRGGSQSDDRTGGNNDKVNKAMQFSYQSGQNFKIIFLSDGPGLTHNDTWYETCQLDGQWDGNVRVTTLKTADDRITENWLLS
ncbi:hypothetical protein BVD23_12775 [Salmonella enterica]|nr:hypothetical protein [Salmonella enterica]ECJ5918490.1 hypothetical protein [Salmonella enterica subsp. salamae]HCM1832270.1 hypothetical protein [Salmonella enterica subsp. salamae serovar 48:z81:z39]HCM1884424.1 hypothetical protein [Salmonella enterica subsp. salamae serovar 60:z10:z39]EAN4946589.1 hypothetical protein [Salmonella enterica]